jgi:hypothetical protein
VRQHHRFGAAFVQAAGVRFERGGGSASGHENERASSRLALRGADVWFPTEGQFPVALAKVLFASHWATQP